MPKTTQRILRGLLVLLGALVVIVTGVLAFGGRDNPPPDVSDLLPHREPIADADTIHCRFQLSHTLTTSFGPVQSRPICTLRTPSRANSRGTGAFRIDGHKS